MGRITTKEVEEGTILVSYEGEQMGKKNSRIREKNLKKGEGTEKE